MIELVIRVVKFVVFLVEEFWYYIRAIARKTFDDDILFLASGLAFNGILTMIALLLLAASGIGWFLNSSAAGVAQMNEILNAIFPPQPFATSIKESILTFVSDIVAYRSSIGIFGVLVLLWTAMSLFDALRSVLHRVYALKRTQSLFMSLAHDVGFVVLALVLFVASNLSIWVFTVIEHLAMKTPALQPLMVSGLNRTIPTIIVILLTTVMFYIVYRFMTDTKPPRTAAIISTVTTTLLWVVSGKLFALYLTHVSAIGKLYGGYAFILVLLFWIYYSCIVFVFGGMVGQAYWERRRWREAHRPHDHPSGERHHERHPRGSHVEKHHRPPQ
jgi:membrane protein